MANGYPVQRGLADIGESLSRGFRDIGERKLKSEELALLRELTGLQLSKGRSQEERLAGQEARLKEMYGLQLPGVQRQSAMDKAQIERENSPVTLGSLLHGDAGALQHWTTVPKGETQSLTQKFGEVTGSVYDTTPDSPTRGQFVKKTDKKPIRWIDIEPMWEEITNLIGANTDPLTVIEDQWDRKLAKFSQMTREGARPDAPEMVKLKSEMAQLTKILGDPKAQIKVLTRHRNSIAKWKNPQAQKAVERIDKNIQELRKLSIMGAEKKEARVWEREKLDIEERGKTRREEMKQAGKLSSQDNLQKTMLETQIKDINKEISNLQMRKYDINEITSILNEINPKLVSGLGRGVSDKIYNKAIIGSYRNILLQQKNELMSLYQKAYGKGGGDVVGGLTPPPVGPGAVQGKPGITPSPPSGIQAKPEVGPGPGASSWKEYLPTREAESGQGLVSESTAGPQSLAGELEIRPGRADQIEVNDPRAGWRLPTPEEATAILESGKPLTKMQKARLHDIIYPSLLTRGLRALPKAQFVPGESEEVEYSGFKVPKF